jgi:hypothetical protein
VSPERGHVHLTEIDGTVVENPLQPGHLTPYRDITPPTVEEIFFRDQLGRQLHPDVLSGLVDIAARATDRPPLAIPALWAGVPVTPARVSWQLRTLEGYELLPTQSTADFLTTIPLPDQFWSVYEPGTYQNFPVVGHHHLVGTPGDYLFDLTPSRLDTRLIPPGTYELTVVAEDTCGNQGTLSQRIRVLPQAKPPPLSASSPHRLALTGLALLPSRPAQVWTVITATVPVRDGLARAQAAAREALDAGLHQVGILTTSPERNLKRGRYLVFTGAYRSWAGAYQAAQLATSRFPGAHPREIMQPRHTRPSRSRLAPAPTKQTLGRYTVILASIPVRVGQAGADALAHRASANRLPSVRLLLTSHFASLRPGYLVVVSGRYPTRNTAIRAAARDSKLYPGAYARLLAAQKHHHQHHLITRPEKRRADRNYDLRGL